MLLGMVADVRFISIDRLRVRGRPISLLLRQLLVTQKLCTPTIRQIVEEDGQRRRVHEIPMYFSCMMPKTIMHVMHV